MSPPGCHYHEDYCDDDGDVDDVDDDENGDVVDEDDYDEDLVED